MAIGAAFGLGLLAVVTAWIAHERDAQWEAMVERNPGGVWTGERRWEPETLKLSF